MSASERAPDARVTDSRPDLAWLAGFGVLLAMACFGVFEAWSLRSSLWEDELIAITHGLQPAWSLPIEVLRNDIHPFLYFLLLKGWTAFNRGSDQWALASSIVCLLFSTFVLYKTVARYHGTTAALWSVAVLCSLPYFPWAASNLRMYALMPATALLCWVANRSMLGEGSWKSAAFMLFVQLAHAYTHAIGFFFCAFIALAALIDDYRATPRQNFQRWLIVQFVFALAVLPVLGNSLVRGTERLAAPDLTGMLAYPVQLIWAWDWQLAGPLAFIAGAAYWVLVLLGVAHVRSRISTAVMCIGVLLACITFGMLGKPMFKAPVYMANILPFMAMGVGAGVSRATSLAVRLGVGAIVVAMACWSMWSARVPHLEENYKPAALYVKQHAKPGDVVVVPHYSVFWGVARYAVAPEWGAPLEVMPLNPNAAWARLLAKLGPVWTQRLGLVPKTDYLLSNGVRYVTGVNATGHTERPVNVWIIDRMNYDETVELATPVKVQEVVRFGVEMAVLRATPDAQGIKLIPNPLVP